MCGSKRVEAKPCCHCLPPQLPLNHMCWKCVHCGDPIVSEGCGLVQVTPWGRVAHRSLIKPRDAGRVVKTRPGSEHINQQNNRSCGRNPSTIWRLRHVLAVWLHQATRLDVLRSFLRVTAGWPWLVHGIIDVGLVYELSFYFFTFCVVVASSPSSLWPCRFLCT